MIGRVARNVNGKAIMYADTVSPAMRQAIDETANRRKRQIAFNEENAVNPKSSARKLSSELDNAAGSVVHPPAFCENLADICHQITMKEHDLLTAADTGQEQRVEDLRNQLHGLYPQFIYL